MVTTHIAQPNPGTSLYRRHLDRESHHGLQAMAQSRDTVNSQELIWPGERDPSSLDVEQANELPEASFMSDFKKALCEHHDASRVENLMHLDLRNTVSGL